MRNQILLSLADGCVNEKFTYISCIMVDCEVCSGKFWLAEALVSFICLIHLLCKCLMGCLGKHTAAEVNLSVSLFSILVYYLYLLFSLFFNVLLVLLFFLLFLVSGGDNVSFYRR